MENLSVMEKIRLYLKENNFYSYRETWPQLAKNLNQEYLDAAKTDNKRNLIFDETWEEIKSFGPTRELIIMELGGSYFKLFKASVQSDKKIVTQKNQSFQFYEDKIYTPNILFSNIKKQLDAFLDDEDKNSIKNVVFIFTFPLEQYKREDGYIDAVCTYFGKTHKSEGIVGMKVGESLQNYLRNNGYENITISVTNDTPASLLSAKAIEISHHMKFDAVMNIIVGTGTNIATGQNIEINGQKKFFIANTEFGNFKSVPLSRFDEIFDAQVDSKGNYLTEKMISGAWQHQIFKVILKDLCEKKFILDEEISNFDFENMDSGEIEKFFKSNKPKNESFEVLEIIWSEITQRGATICGILLSGIMKNLLIESKLDKIEIGIIEVGSVIEKARNFKKVLLDTMDTELARLEIINKVNYHFFNPNFQTVLGATIFDSFFSK